MSEASGRGGAVGRPVEYEGACVVTRGAAARLLLGSFLTVLAQCSSAPPATSTTDGSTSDAVAGQRDLAGSDALAIRDAAAGDTTPRGDVLPRDARPTADRAVPVAGPWVTLPAGTFTMGSPGPVSGELCRQNNEDLHQVTLTHAFEIQATEVTQAEFQAAMSYNPSYHKSCGSTCPVEQVTWHEAAAYCNALSTKKGLGTCYSCSGSGAKTACVDAPSYGGPKIYGCPGYRLPTEAEWEYAYRAGTKTAYYSGTNDPARCATCDAKDPNADAIGWYCANDGNTTHPVRQKRANAWFLYDLAGNVWEWCHDRYQENLGSSPATDPLGTSTERYRVARGGSIGSYSYSSELRAARRGGPTQNSNFVTGFRCARTR